MTGSSGGVAYQAVGNWDDLLIKPLAAFDTALKTASAAQGPTYPWITQVNR